MTICSDVAYLIEVLWRLGWQGQDVVGAAFGGETAKAQTKWLHLEHQLDDGIVDVLINLGYLFTPFTAENRGSCYRSSSCGIPLNLDLLVGEAIDVEYAHLLNDCRLARLGCAQQQDLNGGILEGRRQILDHVIMMMCLQLILLRRLPGATQIA